MEQIIEEIPPVQLRVVKLSPFEGRCARCGAVRSRQPLRVSSAVGAAGVELGPNALSILVRLQHQGPLSKRKTSHILRELFGRSITPGGLVLATPRLAQRLVGDYEALREPARQAAVLHSEETGWYVGKPGYTLWVCTNAPMTF